MPFSGSQSYEQFVSELPELPSEPARPGATQSLFEGLASLSSSSKQLYRLVLVDEATGRPSAYPSDSDLERWSLTGKPFVASAAPPRPPAPQQQLHYHHHHAAATLGNQPSFQELLAATRAQGGPVCAHCGVT